MIDLPTDPVCICGHSQQNDHDRIGCLVGGCVCPRPRPLINEPAHGFCPHGEARCDHQCDDHSGCKFDREDRPS